MVNAGIRGINHLLYLSIHKRTNEPSLTAYKVGLTYFSMIL